MEKMEKEELEQVSGGGRGRGKAVKENPLKEVSTLEKPGVVEDNANPQKSTVNAALLCQAQAYGVMMPAGLKKEIASPVKFDDKPKE